MGFRWRSQTPEGQTPALLRLPIEIRSQILAYLLPHTLPCAESQQIVWRRGSITPLLVNKQLYNECLELVYGNNHFHLTLAYDGIRFRFSWLLPSGLRPNKTYDFPDAFSTEAIKHIRHVLVIVEHVDSYKGMIKYNCGGRGLAQGVRDQVQRLVDLLAHNSAGLGRVTIRLEGNVVLEAIRKQQSVIRARENNAVGGVDQTVLEPLRQLTHVACPCVVGNVESTWAHELEDSMMDCPQ